MATRWKFECTCGEREHGFSSQAELCLYLEGGHYEGTCEPTVESYEVKWQICSRCDGEGTVVHPALSVWTESDRYEDPDGFETMMRGGYDVPCAKCKGEGKLLVDPNEEDGYAMALADAKLRGAEMGDPELYYNPELGLY